MIESFLYTVYFHAETTLNQADLLAAATAEKTALLERLRAYFDETSRAKLLERKILEANAMTTSFHVKTVKVKNCDVFISDS